MAKNILSDSFDIPDPADVIGQENADNNAGLASKNFAQQGAAIGNLVTRNFLGGSPALQKANAEQGAVAAAQQGMAPQAVGEDDTDYAIRRAHGVLQAVAPLDVNAANKVMDHIVTLQQAKQQQALLGAQTQEAEQKSAIERQTQGTFVVSSPDGTKSFGTVNRFNDDGTANPNFTSELQALQQANPGAQVATQQQFFANKGAIEAQRESARLALAQQKADIAKAAGADDPEVVRELAGNWVMDKAALSRQPPEMRDAVMKLMAHSGVFPSDIAGARLQLQFLQSASRAAGARDGNIAILKNSVAGAGQQVLATAQGLDRSRMKLVNQAIIAGKTAFNDPAENRYAAAVQALVTEYARVISGGTGVTSDSARDDAHGILNTAMDMDSTKAVVDQIVNKEMGVVSSASDEAREQLGHPERYSSIIKIQKKLGFQMSDVSPGTPDQTVATVSHDVTQPDPGVIKIDKPKPLSNRIDDILKGR